MFMQKNKEKGITMITLVVTIIVLIILAGVSINMLVGDNGIITKAQQAKENIELAQVEEQTSLNQLYEEMNQEGIYIEDEESIRKDEMIKSLQEHLEEQSKEIEELKKQLQIYKLKEGDYIQYDTGVEGVGVITCRVLYTASSKYGLQIISDKSVKSITLGGSTFEEARVSYNNAIETLNKETEAYLNVAYATDVRCVGSMPTVEDGVFVDKNSEIAGPVTLQFTYNGSMSLNCKGSDNNRHVDYNYMTAFNLLKIGENYWGASRYANSSPTYCNIAVFYVTDGTWESLGGIDVNGNAIGYYHTNGLRPCFLLKNDIKITGGDGKTEKTAYIIENE